MSLKNDMIRALCLEVRCYLGRIRNPMVIRMVSEWPDTYAIARVPASTTLAVCVHLNELANSTGHRGKKLVEQLNLSSEYLSWGQTYSSSEVSDAFLQNYGWMELTGERGPVASSRIACGFLLLGPGVEYPRHAHEAEEIYLPLTGTAYWQRGDEAWQRRRRHEPIYHPSWTPHAMRTESEPLLALYLWRAGNLTQKSVFG